MTNPILTATNGPLQVTNLGGMDPLAKVASFIPLGTAGASATGELAVKVLVVGGGGSGPATAISVVETGAANLSNGNQSVTTSATNITGTNATRRSVTLKNLGGAVCYLGATGVTTTTGVPLEVGESISIDTTAAVFGITAAGTADVRYIQTFD